MLALPNVASSLVEPILGVLGDTDRRPYLIVGGGLAFAVALLLLAVSPLFAFFLLGSMLLYPASGAFVSLSQATLMDAEPEQRERYMARWTAAGSLGAMAGPLLLAGFIALQLGWRPVLAILAIVTLPAVALAASRLGVHHPAWGQSLRTLAAPFLGRPAAPAPAPPQTNRPLSPHTPTEPSPARPQVPRLPPAGPLLNGLRGALRELRRGPVLRRLTLLACSDLLLDVLLGYLGLYIVDVAGGTAAMGAVALTVFTSAGLAGNLLLVPLLSRLDGVRYLRGSAVAALVVFPSFLVVPGIVPKFILLGVLGLVDAGWYPVLQAQLYGELPDRSGTVMSVSTIFDTAIAPLPFLIGLVAQYAGLQAALWMLAAAPIALLLGNRARSA